MATGFFVELGGLIRRARRGLQDNSTDKEIQERVTASIPQRSDRGCFGFVLNDSLNDDLDNRIYNDLVRRRQFERIAVFGEVYTSSIQNMLRKAVLSMPNLLSVQLSVSMEEEQATEVFSILSASAMLIHLAVFFAKTTAEVASPFAKFLRENQVLKSIQLSWGAIGLRVSEAESERVSIPEASMFRICEAISQSKSLETVYVGRSPPSDDRAVVAKLLVEALTKSSSISKIKWKENNKFYRCVCETFMDTLSVQNLDISLRRKKNGEGGRYTIMIFRNDQLKALLSQNVPLNYWPRILEKTKDWNKIHSHKQADVLFFLLKEKNDVLLQNVRCRKIRKRKRFHFT